MNPIMEVNLDYLVDNYIKLNNKFPNFWPVLKDNAYGLGICKVAKTLYSLKCKKFLVIDIDEAQKVKETLNSDDVEIAILNGFFNKEEALICCQNNFIPFISNKFQIDIWKSINANSNIAIFLETGLNRFSLREEDLDYFVSNIKSDIRLVISHLACARNSSNPKNESQKNKFDELCKYIEQHNKIVEKSLCSSEGAANLNSQFLYDSVRLGSCLYGFSKEINNQFNLNNLVSFKAPIIKIMDVKKGDCLGYGDHKIVGEDKTIAVLNLGLANGIYRSMANNNSFFIRKDGVEYKLPIISDITMEYTTVDISGVSFLNEGDFVYLFDYDMHIKDNLDDFKYEDIVHRITSSEPLPYHKEFTLSLKNNKNTLIYIEKGEI